MRIVDAVPFFNEVELLDARVALLLGEVTHHVVVEGDKTHQGDPKPANLWRLTANKKMQRYVVDLPEGGPEANWIREREQRDAIARHLTWLDPPDLVIFTDLDELPDPRAVDRIFEATSRGPVALEMRLFYYGLDWEDPNRWYHGKAARWGDIEGHSLTALRHTRCPVVHDAGWHVSYWGGLDRRRAKVEAFAHAENKEAERWERIERGGEIGPNGEKLTRADLSDVPELLVRRLGAPRG